MPKTQYFTATSLDGYIADTANSLDWLFQAEAGVNAESASGDLYHEFYAQVGALAMGATTYEWVLGHEKLLDKPENWPYTGRRCWVLSHRQLPAVPGADISFASGDVRPVPATLGCGAPLLPRRLMPGELTLTRCADDGTFVHLSYAVSRSGE
jgi:dihydrofolate reductase